MRIPAGGMQTLYTRRVPPHTVGCCSSRYSSTDVVDADLAAEAWKEKRLITAAARHITV
jgi:hypothetical protein